MNDLESSLSAALSAMPTRRPATIGTRLGVSAAETGTHTSRRGRHQFQNHASQTIAAEELIPRLPAAGATLHWLLDGSFTLATVIPVIQRLIAKPVRLTICTLGLNDATTDRLAEMMRDGRLTKLRLAMSSYFRASDAETANRAVQVLTALGAAVASERLHAKLQLWSPCYVLETSSNLRSCQCVEIASLTNDAALYRWHDQWLSKFFAQNSITI